MPDTFHRYPECDELPTRDFTAGAAAESADGLRRVIARLAAVKVPPGRAASLIGRQLAAYRAELKRRTS